MGNGAENQYQSGFGNHFSSEAVKGALPHGQNSPQRAPYGLYAEQLSGSAFTRRPRSINLRSWLYRIQPSVCHGDFKPYKNAWLDAKQLSIPATPPSQMRWQAMPLPSKATNFLQGLQLWALHGDCEQGSGAAIHLYAANQSMDEEFFYNADGEMLLVPQLGGLELATEMGPLSISPGEIAVIPRGVKFQVALRDQEARGYVLENYGQPLALPELGPIGANGLANPRDFLAPTAQYTDKAGDFQLICKFHNQLWQARLNHHPLNVVAWHGNYSPYKYDLRLFNTINTVSFDHPDPSIFTVLTSQSDTPGVANIDFVIFPERWMVAENTFRPPYYHRNIMSEFMGLIYGQYDAKPGGFNAGASSLHNCMSAHGPDTKAFEQGSNEALEPQKQSNTLAFMFESQFVWKPTKAALESSLREMNYQDCWQDLRSHFNPSQA